MYESGAQNPNTSLAYSKAKDMYDQIRRRKTDITNIARNTGFSVEQITIIKNYCFYDSHNLTGGYTRFTPDFAMASSWFRLSERTPRNIKSHDIIMLRHELYEIDLLLHNTKMTQRQAHELAEQKYNYALACKQFYGIK